MQRKLGEYLGQTIIVENRAGAGGTIAADVVGQGEPGRVHDPPRHYRGPRRRTAPQLEAAVQPAARFRTDFHWRRSRATCSCASVPAGQDHRRVREGGQHPARGLPYGTSGVGSAGNLAGELFRLTAKANLIHVPYKGGGPAMSDLLGGQILSVFASATTATPQVKAGKLRALGTTAAKRSATMPDVAYDRGAGYPGY